MNIICKDLGTQALFSGMTKTFCFENEEMDMTKKLVSIDMPFIAFGKKKYDINPFTTNDTSGHAGTIKLYSHENYLNHRIQLEYGFHNGSIRIL